MVERQSERIELPGGFALLFRKPIAGWLLEGPAGTTFLTYSDSFAHAFAAAMRGEHGGSATDLGIGAERYRHKRRGTTYEVVGLAAVQATGTIDENDVVVVYRSEDDGQLWARKQDEFHDGRFERLDPPLGVDQQDHEQPLS